MVAVGMGVFVEDGLVASAWGVGLGVCAGWHDANKMAANIRTERSKACLIIAREEWVRM